MKNRCKQEPQYFLDVIVAKHAHACATNYPAACSQGDYSCVTILYGYYSLCIRSNP